MNLRASTSRSCGSMHKGVPPLDSPISPAEREQKKFAPANFGEAVPRVKAVGQVEVVRDGRRKR